MDKKLLILAILCVICGCTKVDNTPLEERVKYYTMYDSRSRSLEDLETSLDSVITAKNRFHEGLLKMAIGKRYRNKSQFNEAMKLFASTQDIANELSDTLMLIKSYNEFGTAFRRIDALDEATKAHYEALRYCKLYSDQSTYFVKKQKTIALNGVGNVSLTLEFYDKAEETFRECIEIESSLSSDIGLAINYANLGAIYDAKNECDSAMYYYNRSLDHNIKANSQIGISLCNNYLGNIYEKSGELEKAKEYYIKGYEIIENNSDIWHKLVLHTSVARINIKQGEYSEGVENLEQAYKYAKELSSPEHLAIIYKIWADYYEAIGDANRALENLKSINLSALITIPNELFNGFRNLETVDLSNATTIGDLAFKSCSNLNSINLSEAEIIGAEAFSGCQNLEIIDLPKTTTIGILAFYSCSNLNSINLSETEIIGNDAFSGCQNLEIIDLPKTTTIGNGAFMNCENLLKVTNLNATTIGDGAFLNANYLETVSTNWTGDDILQYNTNWGFSTYATVSIPTGTTDAYTAKGWNVHSLVER